MATKLEAVIDQRIDRGYYVNDMTKGNSTSVIAIRLPDPVVARIRTIARRRRQTVNEMLKKVISGFVVGNYYSDEQVARL